MRAREKLNGAYATGCLLVASLFGLATESWTVFVIALVMLLGLSVNNGDIRPGK